MKASINKTWLELEDGKEYFKVELHIRLNKSDYRKMIDSMHLAEVDIHGDW